MEQLLNKLLNTFHKVNKQRCILYGVFLYDPLLHDLFFKEGLSITYPGLN